MRVDAVYDIETEDWGTYVVGGILRADGAYRSYRWTREQQLVEELLSIEGEVWAHNGGRFDHLWLLDHIRKRGYRNIRCVFAGNSMIEIRIGKLVLRDSYRLFPMSLKELSGGTKTETGLKCKGRKELCKRLLQEQKRQNKPLVGCGGYCSIRRTMSLRRYTMLERYLKMDCVSLFESLLSMDTYSERLNLKLGRTVASTGWKSAKESLQLPSNQLEPSEHVFARSGYYGGRVEIYQRQVKRGWVYDVNSSYPARLAQCAIPIGEATSVVNGRATSCFDMERPGIYRVEVSVPSMHIPPLPVRTSTRIVYPTGRFEGVWSLPELRHSIDCGAKISKIREALVWPDSRIIFANWVANLFDARMEAGKDSREGKWLKLIMNSLTGKFGARPFSETIILDPSNPGVCPHHEPCSVDSGDCGGCCRIHCNGSCGALLYLGPGVFARRVNRIDSCAHAEWAAYLTAEARIALHKQLLGDDEGESAAYCHTDSAFVTKQRTKDIGDGLGQWSCEGELEDAIFYAPSLYSCKLDGKEKNRAKGVNVRGLSIADLALAVRAGLPLVNENIRGVRLGCSLGRFFEKQTTERVVKAVYGGRHMLPSGETRPFDASEL